MKRMQLVKLELNNFKGIKHFELSTNGLSVKILGDNATGKTTMFDAFVWLLFDKDSQNKKDFQIKTVDELGKEINGLEHEVEVELNINGTVLTLKKSYKEKWTKKYGSTIAEFTGHTTKHFIDSVPVNQKEFKSKVAEIIDEDVFKLLTSPTYFNEQLKKDDRRNVLMQICGDMTDQEIINSNSILADLPNLNGKKIDAYRKIIAAKRKEINDELEKIPVRINEVNHNLPDLSGLNREKLADGIAQMQATIQEKEAEVSRIKNGAEIVEKQRQLREIEGELLEIKNQHRSKNMDKVNEKRQTFYKLQSEINAAKQNIAFKNKTVANNNASIAALGQETDRLRQEWHEVNDRTFEVDHDTNCPVCRQSLPFDQVKAAHDKALASFNLQKSEDLERINQRGQSLKKQITDLQQENLKLTTEISELEKNNNETNSPWLNELETAIKELEENVQDINNLPQYKQKVSKLEQINSEINQLRANAQQLIDAIENEVRMLREDLRTREIDLAKFDQSEQAIARVNELKEQERKLALEFENLERELHLTEEFIKTKVTLLEDKINSKFKYARFKLFKTQVNGGIEEVCETTFDGVPYSSGLNNAARINVGLDIINTLSDHYGFTAPIFVDNAEAVTKLADVNAQIIELVVSEKDKVLRVEAENTVMREAI